ncbi:hypothetical protein FOVG_17402 [Fusarium oxysporum f. sp. pisi HDV247]|uniref:Transcription factor domain-containing protein n=1 Tax=Fusarium oxysporum f. sp. pisi HDV247 TaxID=1080344 RepID=W9NMQ3_FUSOX|nr:hypothetical protein FOVG_17402 [Fusarium oxysporum f. sp. pisi HDV247]
MALLLTVDTHGFYKDTDSTPRDVFARCAEDAVMRLAFEGAAEPTVIQSLCLIALKHMRTYQPARACMTIGAASRLLAMRKLFNLDSSPSPGNDCISHAYWSAFLFERLFFPRILGLSDGDAPPYPDTGVLPPPSPPLTERHHPSPQVSNRDISITSSCIRLVSTWSQLSTYLHRLRQAEIAKPWLPESTHAKLSLELLEFESQYSKKHLLKNLVILKRLQALADRNHREATSQETTIRFQSAWFWELLDTGIWQSGSSDLSSPYATATIQDDCDTSMSLKSHFIDPFQEEQGVVQEQQPLNSGLDTVNSLFMGSEGLEHFHIDELSFDFLSSGFEI